MITFHADNPDLAEAKQILAKSGVAPELRRRFLNFCNDAPAALLWHANPRCLAGQLATPLRATLRLLLAAVHAGVARLHWDVQCPKCAAIEHRDLGLAQLHREQTCTSCRFVFPQRLDVEVHVTFTMQPPLRSVSSQDDDPLVRQAIDQRLGAVTGQELLVLPEFRALFPREKLLPGESLEVARAAFVFTDLAGSTALYAAQGDPRAFHLIRLHFDALAHAASEQGGTVVKNIGDAVMAAFQTPAEALAAALDMHAAIAALNHQKHLNADERLILKVGIHSGPCLNVTLNERIDYFGTTVNVAARVQGLAQGGDLVFTDAILDSTAVRALLGGAPVQSWHAKLKGLDDKLQVHRVVAGIL